MSAIPNLAEHEKASGAELENRRPVNRDENAPASQVGGLQTTGSMWVSSFETRLYSNFSYVCHDRTPRPPFDQFDDGSSHRSCRAPRNLDKTGPSADARKHGCFVSGPRNVIQGNLISTLHHPTRNRCHGQHISRMFFYSLVNSVTGQSRRSA